MHTCDDRCFLPTDATPEERERHVAFCEAWDRAEAARVALEPGEKARRLDVALPVALAAIAGRPGSAFIHDVEDGLME